MKVDILKLLYEHTQDYAKGSDVQFPEYLSDEDLRKIPYSDK